METMFEIFLCQQLNLLFSGMQINAKSLKVQKSFEEE